MRFCEIPASGPEGLPQGFFHMGPCVFMAVFMAALQKGAHDLREWRILDMPHAGATRGGQSSTGMN